MKQVGRPLFNRILRYYPFLAAELLVVGIMILLAAISLLFNALSLAVICYVIGILVLAATIVRGVVLLVYQL
jgi:uncharacterized membrane protein